MSTNDDVRKAQRENTFVRNDASLVAALADSTGVAEADVARILDQLGLSRTFEEALRINNGVEPQASDLCIAIKIGATTMLT